VSRRAAPQTGSRRRSGKNDNRAGFTPGLQCRLQLLGVVEKNGAVELRARAFSR
jgi:hypothetical protein